MNLTSMVNSVAEFAVGKLGLNFMGTMVLTVRGRKSGEPRSVVVNVLDLNDKQYLLSPHGASNWVKNVRAEGRLQLHRGKKRASYRASEVTDPEEKLAIMRAYLDRWSWQVRGFMGVDKSASDDELRAIIDKHPMFVLQRA